jgi:ribulose-bisphosphate carboxylase large chain
MNAADMEGFFATRATLDPEAYLEVEVTFECTGDPREAAAHLCSEQSTAQWARVGVAEDFRPRFAARVLDLESTPRPHGFSVAVPEASTGAVHACRARLAHPWRNFGASLPGLLSAVMGEGMFFTPGIPLLRVEELHLPASFLAHFAGPQFGVAGVRAQLGVFDRPLFFGVIKPNIGLPPEPFAELGYAAWCGGLDIAKDDEMLTDVPWSPLAERAALLGAARQRAEAETGERKGYLANITGEVDGLADRHDVAVRAGATAVMVNAMPVGLSAIRALRRHATVPLVSHFPFIAAFSRVPVHGVHSRVLTRLQRLAGCDVIIMPGFGGRMMTPEHEVRENVQACLEPMGAIAPALPVPGGSDSAATLERVHRLVGHADFGFVPGRGVFGHPMGPTAGARSLRQAWSAIADGVPVAERAATQPELQSALATFGGR